MVASAPTFFGSNPAEVRVDGPKKGLRVLGDREDTARALLNALDETQRKSATLDGVVPGDIITKTAVKVDPLSPAGIASSAMTPKQRELLMSVIESYTSSMSPDIASERLAQLKQAGLEKITFAWAGESEMGKKHYYRVQGPTFLIEYDNTQNDGNHVHSVWRDFNGDFGRDLLREHVQGVKHE
jgi:DNA-binding transcriptional ArsR family regulator